MLFRSRYGRSLSESREMKTPKKRRVGRLTTNNVVLETHEYVTVNALLESGEDVELIEKSRTPYVRSPDICMIGMLWEMKAPNGKTLRPIERILYRAIKQSPNVIMDLRRAKMSDRILLVFLEKKFRGIRSMRNLWIITKKNEILKLKK